MSQKEQTEQEFEFLGEVFYFNAERLKNRQGISFSMGKKHFEIVWDEDGYSLFDENDQVAILGEDILEGLKNIKPCIHCNHLKSEKGVCHRFCSNAIIKKTDYEAECPVCYEKMERKRRMDCYNKHIICGNCFENLAGGWAHIKSCPLCRGRYYCGCRQCQQI